jgi:hypothetical protein
MSKLQNETGGETTNVAVEESSSTETKADSAVSAADYARVRIVAGALAGTDVLMVSTLLGVTVSTGHPLGRSLTIALYLLAVSIPLLAGCFVATFSNIPWTSYIPFSLGGYATAGAFGAILWHMNHGASIVFFAVSVLVSMAAFVEILINDRPWK